MSENSQKMAPGSPWDGHGSLDVAGRGQVLELGKFRRHRHFHTYFVWEHRHHRAHFQVVFRGRKSGRDFRTTHALARIQVPKNISVPRECRIDPSVRTQLAEDSTQTDDAFDDNDDDEAKHDQQRRDGGELGVGSGLDVIKHCDW